MNLFVAWQDSLTILQPKNLKLFLLVTLKAMGDTFKPWIKYFWWLPLLYVLKLSLTIYAYRVPSEGLMRFLATLNTFPVSLIPSLIVVSRVTLLLAARPSTAMKNCAYFRSYFVRAVVAILVMSSVDELYRAGIALSLQYVENTASLVFNYGLMGIGFLLFMYLINYTLFFFDGDGSFKSFIKSFIYAAKMTIFNLPFYLAVMFSTGAMLIGLSFILALLMPHLNQPGAFVIMLFLMLINAVEEFFVLCLTTNFYIKKVHDQFTLYFGKNV